VILVYSIETQVVLKNLADRLTERASLIAEALKNQPEVWNDSQQAAIFISEVDEVVEGNFFLLRSDGSLVASYSSNQDEEVPGISNLEGLGTAQAGEQSLVIHYRLLNPSVEVLLPVIDAQQQLIGIVAVSQTLESIFTSLGNLRSLIILIVVLQLAGGIIIAIYLARRLARPISQAAAGVVEIAGGVDIAPVPEEGPREIRQLSAAVNSLNERLRSLEETRRRSLANIVHELGRPLGAIQSAIHILLKGSVEPQIERELLEGVDGEVKRMQPLLDDLALLHGQVTGSLVLNLQPTDMSDWLTTSILPWRASALEKALLWEADIPGNLPRIAIDQERMAQVLGNLLSNAIKYTPDGGAVSVSAGSDSLQFWFQVLDDGPGIDPGEAEYIFEPFYRSQKTRRFPQGLGLGLTIARDIVAAHDGELELSSNSGSGSKFTVKLPRNPI
jgi:two-component system sensor histidine kinase BaeS